MAPIHLNYSCEADGLFIRILNRRNMFALKKSYREIAHFTLLSLKRILTILMIRLDTYRCFEHLYIKMKFYMSQILQISTITEYYEFECNWYLLKEIIPCQ